MTDFESQEAPSASVDPLSPCCSPLSVPSADPNRRIDQILTEADRALATLTELATDSVSTADLPIGSLGGDSELAPESVRRKTLTLDVEFGRTGIPTADILSLGPGSVIPLGRPSSPLVNLYCGGHLVAEGEILIQHDRIAVRITRKFPLVSPD